MTSTRLPKKVIKKFGNIPSIELLIERIKKSKFVDQIILATTKNKADNILVEIAKKNHINFFRGNENDVLGRLANALKKRKEENVIQLTGDNPFIDPEIIDYMCDFFIKKGNIDFLTNNGFMDMKKHYVPLGMDVSIFKTRDLIRISKMSKDPEDREHPTLYFYRDGKKIFKSRNILVPSKWKSNIVKRLTLDTKQDYLLLTKIFNHFYFNKKTLHFSLIDIIGFLKKNTTLLKINSTINHKIPSGV